MACVALVACGGPEASVGPFHWDEALNSASGGAVTAGSGGMIAVASAGTGGSGTAPLGGAATEVGGSAGTGGSGGSVALPNAFEDAPAFASAPVAHSALAQMTKSGLNPTKTQCLSCHTGDAGVSAFLAGGTLFTDAAGTQPAVDYEVRVIDSLTQAAFVTHTDENGNFWLPAGDTPPAGPFLIGVRNAQHSQTMPILQRGLECNGSACHGGMQGPVHVP